MDTPQKQYAKLKEKSQTQNQTYLLYDANYTKFPFPDQAKLYRQKADQWLLGAGYDIH